ncbi:site-2 protease family protein [Marispirochaeta sp.]|uniref:site-2 protease family protein n=1 Tax=Marispirochaeta sp. TaxID=2038653 RepID=UPI0029C93A32|nr:site-2 protease family protein [Marispirochaeta sp.]
MGSNIDTMIYMLPAVLIGLTLHEFSHAYVAMLLGDTTAKNDGRITLNPLKHIDPLGMIVLLIAGFGWAKPVKFDPTNLKHPKRDRMLISVAGPLQINSWCHIPFTN